MSETMAAPENPAAFPMTGEGFGSNHYNTWQAGMTLRDYFAGQALAGLMANASMPFAPDYAECEPSQIADASYEIADALLAARSTK
jgi:hypothetical protein